MLRAVFSILLAALLVATGAASAAHALVHEAPHGHHGVAMHGEDHSVALAECCDAPGAQASGGCLMDAACLGPLVVGPTAMGERPIAFGRSFLVSGISAAVPTGPPKV